MSVRNQPGKDPEGGKEPPNLRMLYDDILPSGRVLISVADKDLEDHVVIPIPKSYEAAMTIAFDQLGGHIPTNGRSLLEGAYFRYCMRSPTGDVAWAKLPPEFWKEIIKDGDHLKLCHAPAAQPARFATFFLKISGNRREDLVTSPLPEGYREAVGVVREALKSKDPRLMEDLLILYAGNTVLGQANWASTFATNDGSVEIRVVIVPFAWDQEI